MPVTKKSLIPIVVVLAISAGQSVLAFDDSEPYLSGDTTLIAGEVETPTTKQIASSSTQSSPNEAKIFPPAADSAYYLAGQYLVSGQYHDALSYFDQAIKLASTGSGHFRIADAFYSKGNAHVYLGQSDRAIEDYSKAIQLDSAYALAYYMRGQTYESIGQHEKAIDDFKKSIELDQHNALAFGGLALVYHRTGEQQRAVEYASNSISLDANNAWFYDLRAQALWELGQLDRYVQDISKEIELLSNAKTSPGATGQANLLAPAYFNRAQAYEKLGKNELARKDMDRARELGYKTDVSKT